MTINQPISGTLPASLPDRETLMAKAAAPHAAIVYQSYRDAAQRAQIGKATLALDISFQKHAETREFEIRKILHEYHASIDLPEDTFWGLLPAQFERNSVSSTSSFISEAEAARAEGADAYLHNPMIGHAAIYSNVWEHASMGGHPGMEPIFGHLQKLGYPVAPPQGQTAFFFGNYFAGNRRFWNGYFAFCETILRSLEQEVMRGTAAGRAYGGTANFALDADAAMRPAVIDRLLGLYIPHAVAAGMKVAALVPSAEDFEAKFGKRIGGLLHDLYMRKEAFLRSRDAALLNSWQEGRSPVVKQPHLVWQSDDPPAWVPRARFADNKEYKRAYSVSGDNALPAVSATIVESLKAPASPVAVRSAAPSLRPFEGGWNAHKDRHCIWIVTPQDYIHSHAFDEVALGLHGAFEELGGSAPIVRDMNAFNGRAPIVYGGNLLPAEVIGHLPKDSVIINLEQVSKESTWINERYTSILKSFPVLDYSARNRNNLAERGIGHAGVLEIGYSQRLTQIEHAPVKDIDVLFYGSMNDRRYQIIKSLQDAGLNVVHLFSIYGAERDAAIARAKVVINIHHYEIGVFEIVRISYLLANRICVLTEGNAADPDLEPFAGGLAVAPYENLVERCKTLLADEAERDAIAARGFAAMSGRSQAEMLMSVMNSGE